MALPVNAMEQEIVEALVASPLAPTSTAHAAAGGGQRGGGAKGGGAKGGVGGGGPAVLADGHFADVLVLCGETGSGKSTQVGHTPTALSSPLTHAHTFSRIESRIDSDQASLLGPAIACILGPRAHRLPPPLGSPVP
jgi:hypothetical protein